MKILIADDSKTNLALTVAALKKLGHEVVPANNGKQAIELIKESKPDLIILDVMMEGIDGFECAKIMRAMIEPDWIPIIFLSSSVDDYSVEKGINSGGDDYLTKPFSEVKLAAKIKAMQRISDMRKQLYDTTKELKILSSTDTLTGLYNRHQFEKTLQERLSESDRYKNLVTLMFIDVDYFKNINDTLGHSTGDLLLKEIAFRLKSIFRLEDFIARLGGDEFVVILSHVEDVDTIESVADKIVKTIAAPMELASHKVRVTCSVGIAFYPYQGVTHENFLQNADIAMYHAKEEGRNNYQFFNQELSLSYRKHVSIEEELKYAIERNQLSLMYQPIIDITTKKLFGMEAILKWQHDKFGFISPNVFIPMAEQNGLITTIGYWLFSNAMKQVNKWYHQGYKDFKLSMNVSLHQFLQSDLYVLLSDYFDKYHLPASLIQLEISETSVITYTESLKNTVSKLHDLGVSISVDDFGTKFSSLVTLRNLPVNALKIDKTFLKNITTNKKNSIIVKSLIALGNSLNLNVIAEGVDHKEQFEFLVLNGCKFGQGNLISKVLETDDMTKFLDKPMIEIF